MLSIHDEAVKGHRKCQKMHEICKKNKGNGGKNGPWLGPVGEENGPTSLAHSQRSHAGSHTAKILCSLETVLKFT